MVVSMPVYRIVKKLCVYCNRTNNGFELIDRQTVAIKSGNMSGLVLTFEPHTCMVTINNKANLCIDIGCDSNVEWLLLVLIHHNIVYPPPCEG